MNMDNKDFLPENIKNLGNINETQMPHFSESANWIYIIYYQIGIQICFLWAPNDLPNIGKGNLVNIRKMTNTYTGKENFSQH